MIDIVATFIFFVAVIDPVGTLPVFLAVTGGLDAGARRRVALRASGIAALVLICFVLAGELVLTALAIPLSAFQIAGGIVLFLFALTMIFGESKPEEELKKVEDHDDPAVFPLAIPSIAGPGAMLGAVLMTENTRYTILEQAQTTGVMLGVLVLTLLLLLAANRIHRFVGTAGASVISRVMGLILASVATTSTLGGIRLYFEL